MLIASRNRLARLQYGPNGFRTLSPGDHVLCAVSGAPIGLEISGPTMVLATAGEVAVASNTGNDVALQVGTVAFADSAEGSLTVSGVGEVFIAGPGR